MLLNMIHDLRERTYDSHDICDTVMDIDNAMRSTLFNREERLIMALVFGLEIGKVRAKRESNMSLWEVDNLVGDVSLKLEALMNGYASDLYPEFDEPDQSLGLEDWLDGVAANEYNPLTPPVLLLDSLRPKVEAEDYKEDEEVEYNFYQTSPYIEDPMRKHEYFKTGTYDYFRHIQERYEDELNENY